MNITLEQVYDKANKYSTSVMKRYGLPFNKFSPEDIVGEFMVKFIDKGFLERFDGTKSSFNYYVYKGLSYMAIKMVRHIKREITSFEGVFLLDYPCYGKVEIPEFEVEDLIDSFNLVNVKKSNTIWVKDKEYKFNSRSILQLIYQGYTKKEIALLFSVNCNVIYRIISKVRKEQGDRYKRLNG